MFLLAGGCFLVAAILFCLAIVGRRDERQGVPPDLLPDDLRKALGLWSERHPGEGSVRAEHRLLAPDFRNARRVAFNVVLGAVMTAAGVVIIVDATLGRSRHEGRSDERRHFGARSRPTATGRTGRPGARGRPHEIES